ncbi:MAG TPA: OmpA family protein [Chitinophagales bacterium]|nr:OmpA family protein [Chitinophagales bacterium]
MKKTSTLTVFALLLSLTISFAQQHRVGSKNLNTELKIGDKFYAESYYYTAAEYYKDVVRQDSSNRYGNFWLAMSLLQARDYEGAETFFRKFYAIKPGEKTNKKRWDEEDAKLFNTGGYYFGQVLHRNGKYDEAIEYLNKFNARYTPKDENDNLKKLAALEIAGCEFSKTAPKAKIKIFNAGPGVNKAYTEAAPFGVGETEMYYTSKKGESNNLVFVEGPKSKAVYQIMHSTKEGETWGVGTALSNKDINEEGYIVGNGTFNKAGTRFYFTKCVEMDDDRSLCNIFVADAKEGGSFGNVTRLPEPINEKEKYTSTQPTVRTSEDGMEIVYFATDRPGGPGGLDIWYFIRTGTGEYKGPKVLKGPVNSTGDEGTPFFDDSTRTLYFSSNGHPGLGGLDVFKSTESADLNWSDVTHVGYPVSTGADDLYYSRSTDQTNGFLVSNREGSVPLNGIKTASDDIFYWTNFRYAVQGVAFKEGDTEGGALQGAKFNLYRKLEDGTKVLVGVDSMHTDGSYFFKLNPETDYVVEVIREGFQPKIENISTKGLPDEDTINNNIVIRKAMYTVKGLVSEEGKDALVGANVQLIEVFPNGMEKTIYYMKSDPYYYFDVDFNKTYKLVFRKDEFFTKTVDLNTANLGQIDTIRKDVSIAKLELNKTYTLQNVLYEFGKSTLTENSKAVLDNLYQIMVENPAFVIELSAHTDAIGSDAANLKLSQARAESCVSYLISKGITKDRMVAKGYGETMPKVPNNTEDGKDDPAGRAINRRTEFKITGIKKAQ